MNVWCYKCGKLIPEEYQRTCIHCGYTYCPICYGEHFLKEERKCVECDNTAYCKTELNTWMTPHNCGMHELECVICGERVPEVDGVFTDNYEFVCDSCYNEYFIECYECGREIDLRGDEYGVVEGDCFCTSCYNELFGECSHCGYVVNRDELYFCQSNNEWYCENCFERFCH